MSSSILELRGIRKLFGDAVVLHGVDLDVRAGEVHALVGENGAGKSTLMRIAAGVLTPDSGEMAFCGEHYEPRSPGDALNAGIAMVHQELSLVPDLTVAENIMAGREPRRGWFVDWRRLHDCAAEMLAEFCPAVDPYAMVGTLSLGYRQTVEIIKALAWKPKAIIFDEPTSSLEAAETERLLATIEKLRAKGEGVIYISHRLDEVFVISDRITVLRDGRKVSTSDTGDTCRETVLQAMVGRTLAARSRRRNAIIGRPLLTVKHLTQRDRFRDVSFELRQGEILGFSGIIGAGRTELMRAIFAAEPYDSGSLVLDGKQYRFRSIADAIHAGIAYLPEDRKTQGLFLGHSLKENILSGNIGRCSRHGMVSPTLSREMAIDACQKLFIRATGIEQDIGTLSGGNQQKALLGRWLASSPLVLMVDEPTRGIDVGAKAEIYELLREFAEGGRGVMVASSEMPELLSLCDRIIVMHEGRLAGEVPGETATEQQLIHMATGSAMCEP